MMDFLASVIELMNWVWIFISPASIFGLAGYAVYYNFNNLGGIVSSAGLFLLGIGLGIYFAERIRQTIGCTAFFGRLLTGSANAKDENKVPEES